MRAISLFSGVGGFEQGFDRAGIETILQVEIDPACREILARHWPTTPRLEESMHSQLRLLPFCPTITTGGGKIGQGYQGFILGDTLCRYTLLEQERLMGWADDWTRHRLDGQEFSDTQRQRFLGNGVASPVAEWLGRRLVQVASERT